LCGTTVSMQTEIPEQPSVFEQMIKVATRTLLCGITNSSQQLGLIKLLGQLLHIDIRESVRQMPAEHSTILYFQYLALICHTRIPIVPKHIITALVALCRAPSVLRRPSLSTLPCVKCSAVMYWHRQLSSIRHPLDGHCYRMELRASNRLVLIALSSAALVWQISSTSVLPLHLFHS
jgi:hypothetical protein